MSRDERLQALCRGYLRRVRRIASRYGLGSFVDNVIQANRRKECESTRDEVEMLARMVNDDRIERSDIPKALGKSYRRCLEDGDFASISKMEREGVYSKISVLLRKRENHDRKRRCSGSHY